MNDEIWMLDRESFAIVDWIITIVFLAGIAMVIIMPEPTGRAAGWVLGQIGQFLHYVGDQASMGMQQVK